MDIHYERPSQRLHHRVTAPFQVAVLGQSLAAVDWSLGGFRVRDVSGDLPEVGSQLDVTCTLPFQGFQIAFQTQVEVCRVDLKTCAFAAKFLSLGEREAALMQHFIEDLVRGLMTDVADTIVRIDTPVTPVPTTPDPNPAQHVPARRWPVKQIVMTLFYMTLGIAVFGYVGVYTFATLFRLEVTAAVVQAERREERAPLAGQIVSLAVQPGDRVHAGDVLVRVRNLVREQDLRKAELDVMSIRAELGEARSLLAEEQRRSDGFALVATNNLRQAETQLRGLRLARDAALKKVERYRALFDRGHVVRADLDVAELELSEAESELARKQIHIEELRQLIDAGESVQLFTGNGFAGRLAEARAEVARLTGELAARRAHLDGLTARTLDQSIRASASGRIAKLHVEAGMPVKPGDPLVVLERETDRSVAAFLTQDEVSSLRIGSTAKLYIPSQAIWVNVRVDAVSRTDGFIDEVTEMHRFRAPQSRSARATLVSIDAPLPPPGTPVTVYFKRYRSNLVVRTLEATFGERS